MKNDVIDNASSLDHLDFAALYASVPVRNEQARLTPLGDRAILQVPLKKPTGLFAVLGWLMPFSRVRRTELDELGTRVLCACDGRTTVRDLIATFRARYHLTFHEARLSIALFLKQLLRHGAIAVQVPHPGLQNGAVTSQPMYGTGH